MLYILVTIPFYLGAMEEEKSNKEDACSVAVLQKKLEDMSTREDAEKNKNAKIALIEQNLQSMPVMQKKAHALLLALQEKRKQLQAIKNPSKEVAEQLKWPSEQEEQCRQLYNLTWDKYKKWQTMMFGEHS